MGPGALIISKGALIISMWKNFYSFGTSTIIVDRPLGCMICPLDPRKY